MGADPSGLQTQQESRIRWDDPSPQELLAEFVGGQGIRHSKFIDGMKITRMMQDDPYVSDVRQIVATRMTRGLDTNARFDFNYQSDTPWQRRAEAAKDGLNFVTNGCVKNLAASFLGSYGMYVSTSKVDHVHRTMLVEFHMWNSTSLESATREPGSGYSKNYKPIVRNPSSGPFSTTTQDIYWAQRIHY